MDELQINLNSDEAIVLFEFLSRFSETAKLEIVDQAEAKVLWNLLAGLETKLVEPFSDKYSEVLKIARENIIRGV